MVIRSHTEPERQLQRNGFQNAARRQCSHLGEMNMIWFILDCTASPDRWIMSQAKVN